MESEEFSFAPLTEWRLIWFLMKEDFAELFWMCMDKMVSGKAIA